MNPHQIMDISVNSVAIQIAGSLVLVLLVFFIVIQLSKYFHRLISPFRKDKSCLHIEQRYAVDTHNRLVVVEFDNKRLLLGVSKGVMVCLAESSVPTEKTEEVHV